MQRNNTLFTLIEAVLAVSVFAVMLVLILSVLFSVEKTWHTIKRQTEELDDRLKLDRIAENMFRNAVPFYWPDKNGKDKQIFLGRSDRIIFAYLHRISTEKDSGLRFVELFMRDECLVARYRREPILYWEPGTDHMECKEEIILKDVKDIRFSYADKNKKDIVWLDEWDTDIDDRIPLAVSMVIEFKNETCIKYLRRTAGSSYYTTYGKRIEKITPQK